MRQVNGKLQKVSGGYKQTELGMIPGVWNAVQLKELFVLKNGYSFKGEFFSNIGPILLTPGNFKLSGGLYFEDRNTKRYDGDYPKGFELDYGDLVVVMTDLTPDCNLLGKPAFVREREKLLHNQRIGKITRLVKSWDKNFLYYSLLSPRYLTTIKNSATGSTVRHTSPNAINGAWVLEPPKKEQIAIANALSDVDALITSLEKLIDKKRAIRTAAMQQLLTGKKRLPPFDTLNSKKGTSRYKQTELGEVPEDWEVKSVGEFAPLQRGFDLPNRDRVNGIYPVVYSNGVVNYHNSFQVKGPGVVTGRSGTIGNVHFVEENFWPHNTALWVTKFNNADPKFVYYLYEKIGFSRFSSGSGVPTLNRNDAHSYKIAVPSEMAEQQSISNALSDMDKEISALEQRLSKTQQLKQGMMQELLTGRTRLV